MRFVQVVLTDTQVGLLKGATQNAITDAGNEQEATQLASLVYFLEAVEVNPDAFPVTGTALRRTIRKSIARAKGPAQPRPNKRKRAQLRAQGSQKRTRAQKRIEALAYNAEREAQMETVVKEKAKGLGILLPSRRRKREFPTNSTAPVAIKK
jgi:hypothetical protein